jgi:hypothetical protein
VNRYRVVSFDFDSRATILCEEINPSWEESVRAQWEQNQHAIREGLLKEFGSLSFDSKLNNFKEVGPRPFSILAFHNRFAAQIRTAFVAGGYYPALTGASALGERILNHLIRELRDDFKHSAEYRKIARKDSFDNWDNAINTLVSWDVLLPATAEVFRELSMVRNRVIHFHPATDTNDRLLALEGITLLDRVVNAQFPINGYSALVHPQHAGRKFHPSRLGETTICAKNLPSQLPVRRT